MTRQNGMLINNVSNEIKQNNAMLIKCVSNDIKQANPNSILIPMFILKHKQSITIKTPKVLQDITFLPSSPIPTM